MIPLQSFHDEFYLEIGPFSFAIECDKESLAKKIRAHYRDFWGKPSNSDIKITVHTLPGDLPIELDAKIGQNIAIFNSPGFQGKLDISVGHAEMVICSKQALECVDYFCRVAIALYGFENGGLLFHASGLVRSGKAYLFAGHSGVGKTTVAKVSKDTYALNDDLLLLMPDNEQWVVYSTPFFNPTQVCPKRGNAPLIGIYFLIQDKEVFLESMSKGLAIGELIANCPVIVTDPSLAENLLTRCQKLYNHINMFRLHFLPDDSFWEVIDKARH